MCVHRLWHHIYKQHQVRHTCLILSRKYMSVVPSPFAWCVIATCHQARQRQCIVEQTCGVLFCTGHLVHGSRQGVLPETSANHLVTPASKQSLGPVVQAGSPSLLQHDGAQALMPVPPQQPVTNPWMERLLQELSFDDAQVNLLNTNFYLTMTALRPRKAGCMSKCHHSRVSLQSRCSDWSPNALFSQCECPDRECLISREHCSSIESCFALCQHTQHCMPVLFA